MRDSRAVTVHAAVCHGIDVLPCDVRATATGRKGSLTFEGVEAERLRLLWHDLRFAIASAGFSIPSEEVRLGVRYAGRGESLRDLGLAVAAAVLAATSQIDRSWCDHCLFVGMVDALGNVEPARGLFGFKELARRDALTLVGAPMGSGWLAPVHSYRFVGRLCDLRQPVSLCATQTASIRTAPVTEWRPDFAQIRGHEVEKRAIVIAVAGSFGLMLVGPPGSGKSDLAFRIPTVMGALTSRERDEVAHIHSIAGLDAPFLRYGGRPFRGVSPQVALHRLVGGGAPVMPGEVTLANHGVLFLNDMPNFSGPLLQALRVVLESGQSVVTRADDAYVFPASFMLVVSARPCPCGKLGQRGATCSCTPARISRYARRRLDPLKDHIAVHVNAGGAHVRRTGAGVAPATSQQMAEAIGAAAAFRSWRYAHGVGSPTERDEAVAKLGFDDKGADALRKLERFMAMGQGKVRQIAHVARTVADLAESTRVGHDHVCEASAFVLGDA